MIKLGLLVFSILIPFVFSQSCNYQRQNSSCSSSSGLGVCCQYQSSYYCFAGYDKCCGYDGLCEAGMDCCPGAYGSKSYCLRGYKCCNAGRSSLYICDPGTECCAGGCCTVAELAGWAIAIIVIGAVAVIGAVGFCIYKQRQNRIRRMHLEGGYYREPY